jgi:murein DD-endopeptidase MepM/ murein hydrolase activator NlpD
LGIDIALMPGDAVAAMADGVVVFAGGNRCCSYGLFVVIEHANGFQSLYSHLSRLDVVTGAKVSRGEMLGLGGATGHADGPHLHFEVRWQGALLDPLTILPR